MKTLNKTLIIIAISFASLNAQATGCPQCATEWTQLTNKVQLISQVGESVRTTANTLQTAQATMQQLRQLGPETVRQMTGLPIDQVKKLADAYQVMSSASSAYSDAADVLKKVQSDSQRLNITPTQLFQMKADVANAYGGVYKQQFDQEQAKLKRLADVSNDVQSQSTQIGGINSSVGGIQVLANQNLKMQVMLTTLNESIATANSLAAQVAQQAQQAQAQGNIDAARTADAYQKAVNPATGGITLPTEIKLTK